MPLIVQPFFVRIHRDFNNTAVAVFATICIDTVIALSIDVSIDVKTGDAVSTSPIPRPHLELTCLLKTPALWMLKSFSDIGYVAVCSLLIWIPLIFQLKFLTAPPVSPHTLTSHCNSPSKPIAPAGSVTPVTAVTALIVWVIRPVGEPGNTVGDEGMADDGLPDAYRSP